MIGRIRYDYIGQETDVRRRHQIKLYYSGHPQGLERSHYDEFELRIGDSLRRKIDKGIANSNFGVIVISRDFINKGWTNYELDGLITRAVNGEQTMLPVWHNITKREVINYSPSLADKLARSTTDFTVEEIADEIADLIQERKGA